MGRRFKDRTAKVTYFSLLWGIGVFIVSFKLEGWGMGDITRLFSDPVGILGIILIGVGATLFTINLFSKELSPDEWVKKRDGRLPDLLLLKGEIGKYIKTTHEISKNNSLYTPDNLSFTLLLMLINNNDEYLKLKIDGAGSLVDSINLISARFQNSKLDKLINQTFQDEHKARSQQIVIRLFRNNYPHSKRNERKLLEVESQLRKSNNVRKFTKTLKRLFSHIELMERGKDLW